MKLFLLSTLAAMSLAAQTQTYSWVGPYSSRPSSCANGNLGFATDQAAGQNVYSCLNNVWTQISGGTGNVTGFGTTGVQKLAAFNNTSATAIKQILTGTAISQSVVNDYTAPIDGTTDAYAAFQAAANSGANVYVPCTANHGIPNASTGLVPEYLLSHQVVFKNGTHFWSDCQPFVYVNNPSPSSGYDSFPFIASGTWTDYPSLVPLHNEFPDMGLNLLQNASYGATTLTCSTTGCAATLKTNLSANPWIYVTEGPNGVNCSGGKCQNGWADYYQIVKATAVDSTSSVVTIDTPLEWIGGVTSTYFGFLRINPVVDIGLSGLTIGTAQPSGHGSAIGALVVKAKFDHNITGLVDQSSDFSFFQSSNIELASNTAYHGGLINGVVTHFKAHDNIYANVGNNPNELAQGEYDIQIVNNSFSHVNVTGSFFGTSGTRSLLYSGNFIQFDASTADPLSLNSGDSMNVSDNVIVGNWGANGVLAFCSGAGVTNPAPFGLGCSGLTLHHNVIVPIGQSFTYPIFSLKGNDLAPNASVTDNVFVGATQETIQVSSGPTYPANVVGWTLANNQNSYLNANIPIAPASVTAAGVNAGPLLSGCPTPGGATTGTGQTAGLGCGITITTGIGGAAVSGSTNGNGGDYTVQTGSGGGGAGAGGHYGGLFLQPSGGCIGIGVGTGGLNCPNTLVQLGGALSSNSEINISGADFYNSTAGGGGHGFSLNDGTTKRLWAFYDGSGNLNVSTGSGSGSEIIGTSYSGNTSAGVELQTAGVVITKQNASGFQPTTIYSAAGTALPTCGGSSAPTNTILYVKDATALGVTYVSGGTVWGGVICDGTNWHAF